MRVVKMTSPFSEIVTFIHEKSDVTVTFKLYGEKKTATLQRELRLSMHDCNEQLTPIMIRFTI